MLFLRHNLRVLHFLLHLKLLEKVFKIRVKMCEGTSMPKRAWNLTVRSLLASSAAGVSGQTDVNTDSYSIHKQQRNET